MSCIFCEIIKGNIPSLNIYEDDQFIAFLDKFPQTPGHCQVIPKKHYRWVWYVPQLGAYFEVCGKIANAMKNTFKTDIVHSKIIGDEVCHAHIWLIPIHNKKISSQEEIATMIKKYL